MTPAAPGWLALIKCPEWGTYHFAMVDAVDEEGYVVRSHTGTGEPFDTERAVGVCSPEKLGDVLACIRRFPDPFAAEVEATTAVQDWRAYECE